MGDAPETLQLGNYDILKREDDSQWRLGQGSYGTTFKARHRHLRRVAALKVINDALVQNNQARQRFLHEAQSAASLDHPNIAKIYDFGDNDGVFFYAMEFCGGGTLEDISAQHGGLTWDEVCIVAHGIGRALEHAHGKGLLHRDLKPANAMLMRPELFNSVKLIDFGLVKVLDPEKSDSTNLALTREGSFMGNPLTASPEQLNEEELDERSDLFSLGITLWYLLIGRSPFENLSAAKVVHQRLDPEPYADQLPEDLSDHARAILAKLLEKNHDDRFASATEFLAALDDPTFGVVESASDDHNTADSSAPHHSIVEEPEPQTADLDILGKIIDVSSGGLYSAADHDSREPLSFLVPPSDDIEVIESHLAELRKLPPCSLLRFRYEAQLEDDHILVFDPLRGLPLGDLLRTVGSPELRRCLAILVPIAETLDHAGEAGIPGVELRPELIWIMPSETPDEGAPYSIQLIPMLVESGQAFELGSTIDGSDLDIPALSQFGALIYRIVSGMAVKQIAFHTTNAYVNTSELTEESNRFLSEVISNAIPGISAAEILTNLAEVEGAPLAEAFTWGRDLFKAAQFPPPPTAIPLEEKSIIPPQPVLDSEPAPTTEATPAPPPRSEPESVSPAPTTPEVTPPSKNQPVAKAEPKPKAESKAEPATKKSPKAPSKAAAKTDHPAQEDTKKPPAPPPDEKERSKSAEVTPPSSPPLQPAELRGPKIAPKKLRDHDQSASSRAGKGAKEKRTKIRLLILLVLAVLGLGALLLLFNKDFRNRIFGAAHSASRNWVSSGAPGTIPLTISGLRIQPTPDRIVLKRSGSADLKALPGNSRGLYELRVAADLRDSYTWPLAIEVQLPGYQVAQPITLSRSALTVSKASASYDADRIVKLIPTRTLQIFAKHKEQEVPLPPSVISLRDGSIAPAEDGSTRVRIQGPPGKDYPLDLTIAIPGFDEVTTQLSAGDEQLTVGLQRQEGIVKLLRPKSSRPPDFSDIKLLPRPEDIQNEAQRKLLESSLPILQPLIGEPFKAPSGSYDLKIADGLWEGASLGVLEVQSQPCVLDLPAPIQGVYFGNSVDLGIEDTESRELTFATTDVAVWLTNDKLGPRFVCFQRKPNGHVGAVLGAPLQLQSYDHETLEWTFKVDWKAAIDRHEKDPVRDDDFLSTVGARYPAVLHVQSTSASIVCELREIAPNRVSGGTKWRGALIAPDLARGRLWFEENELFDDGTNRIPIGKLTMERWFGTVE